MAAMPKCTICEHYNFRTRICSKYNESPPENILLEYIECDKFQIKSEDDTNDPDLPIAKGR